MIFAMATLGLKEMGKLLWEGTEKVCPVGCLSPKVAIAEFFWRMHRETWYSSLVVDAMPLSLKNLLLKCLKMCIISFRLWCWRSFRHRRFRLSVPTHAFGVNPTRSCENGGCQFGYVKMTKLNFVNA